MIRSSFVDMEIDRSKARTFYPSSQSNIEIKIEAEVLLNNDEQITFKSRSNKSYDFVAKDWGYYVTGSINSRLKNEGYSIALVVNKSGRKYIMCVDNDLSDTFETKRHSQYP